MNHNPTTQQTPDWLKEFAPKDPEELKEFMACVEAVNCHQAAMEAIRVCEI